MKACVCIYIYTGKVSCYSLKFVFDSRWKVCCGMVEGEEILKVLGNPALLNLSISELLKISKVLKIECIRDLKLG